MSTRDLIDLVAALSPEQQDAVEKFVRILKEQSATSITFRTALDEFAEKHPDLLRRLTR